MTQKQTPHKVYRQSERHSQYNPYSLYSEEHFQNIEDIKKDKNSYEHVEWKLLHEEEKKWVSDEVLSFRILAAFLPGISLLWARAYWSAFLLGPLLALLMSAFGEIGLLAMIIWRVIVIWNLPRWAYKHSKGNLYVRKKATQEETSNLENEQKKSESK